MASKTPSAFSSALRASRSAGSLTRSVLLMTAMAGPPLLRRASTRTISGSLSAPCGSNSIIETSTSAMESLAVLSIRLPSLLCALCTPGVSSRTYCNGPRVTTPVMRVRVVWGLEVTMATL